MTVRFNAQFTIPNHKERLTAQWKFSTFCALDPSLNCRLTGSLSLEKAEFAATLFPGLALNRYLLFAFVASTKFQMKNSWNVAGWS